MAAVIILFLIAFIHDYRLKTDEVKIRIFETWYSERDNLFYKAEFKKKGAILWTNFVDYSRLQAEVSQVTKQTPEGFYYLKNYTYKQCKEHNEEAYDKQRQAIKDRRASRYIEL